MDGGLPPQDGGLDAAGIVARSNSSFSIGMRALPRRRREAIFAVYAFCRTVDDVVDSPGPAERKALQLDFWETEIDRAYGGRARTRLGGALSRAARDHGLPREEFELVLEGMRMDIACIVGPDAATLDRYVRRVAGAVGVLAMHVFGCWRGAPSRRFALALGEAMQFTNILRDVEEDAAIGRVYLPREILDEVGIAADPAGIATASGLPEARRILGLRARASYREAAREVAAHGRLRLAPALLMMGPYERLLGRMEADWTRRPAPRPGWRKALDGLRCVTLGGASG